MAEIKIHYRKKGFSLDFLRSDSRDSVRKQGIPNYRGLNSCLASVLKAYGPGYESTDSCVLDISDRAHEHLHSEEVAELQDRVRMFNVSNRIDSVVNAPVLV